MKYLLTVLAGIFFLSINTAYAIDSIDYAPLEPLPGLQNASNVNFAQFLGLIFNLLLTAGALLAVGTLVYAGISYILSEAFETKGEARKRMVAALYGLVILLGAWLLLNTINPALLKFDLSSINTRWSAGTNTGGISSNTGGTGTNTGGVSGNTGGSNVGNASSTATTTSIIVNGGNGKIIVYTSGPYIPSASQMKSEENRCKRKGLVFKATSETGSDEDGSYTIWSCQ